MPDYVRPVATHRLALDWGAILISESAMAAVQRARYPDAELRAEVEAAQGGETQHIQLVTGDILSVGPGGTSDTVATVLMLDEWERVPQIFKGSAN